MIEPTKSELEILKVLWIEGPSTVRRVFDQLKAQQLDLKYTTTLKLMQIMLQKGIVRRDESQIKHIYFPKLKEEAIKNMMINKMKHSLFNDSAYLLVVQILKCGGLSKKDIENIKKQIQK